MNTKIKSGSIVQLALTAVIDGKPDPGTNFDREKPFVYMHGGGEMIPSFEKLLDGLEVGAKLEVTLTPEEHGIVRDETLVVLIPKMMVLKKPGPDLPNVGDTVGAMTNAGPMKGVLVEITENGGYRVDFNSVLAGKTAVFTTEVLAVRKPDLLDLLQALGGGAQLPPLDAGEMAVEDPGPTEPMSDDEVLPCGHTVAEHKKMDQENEVSRAGGEIPRA
jgi:FKBP-type peptidyl-prolyl cis-trans isomerase 2